MEEEDEFLRAVVSLIGWAETVDVVFTNLLAVVWDYQFTAFEIVFSVEL